MENSSKTLVITGAILVCMMIVAVGMFIYSKSGASIEDTVVVMSTTEIETYNAVYTAYEGEQTGTQIKAMVGKLISNVQQNANEKTKIPGVYLENKDNVKKSFNSEIPDAGESQAYIDALQNIRSQLEPKHKYWVEINYQNNGLIDYINISYDRNNIIEPINRN